MRSRGLYEENHNGNLHHLTRRDPCAWLIGLSRSSSKVLEAGLFVPRVLTFALLPQPVKPCRLLPFGLYTLLFTEGAPVLCSH